MKGFFPLLVKLRTCRSWCLRTGGLTPVGCCTLLLQDTKVLILVKDSPAEPLGEPQHKLTRSRTFILSPGMGWETVWSWVSPLLKLALGLTAASGGQSSTLCLSQSSWGVGNTLLSLGRVLQVYGSNKIQSVLCIPGPFVPLWNIICKW